VKGSAVSRLVSKFFGGSPVSVVAHLLENDALDAEDLKALHAHLNGRLAKLEKNDQ
jgi:predicted transcriptional regulator